MTLQRELELKTWEEMATNIHALLFNVINRDKKLLLQVFRAAFAGTAGGLSSFGDWRRAAVCVGFYHAPSKTNVPISAAMEICILSAPDDFVILDGPSFPGSSPSLTD